MARRSIVISVYWTGDHKESGTERNQMLSLMRKHAGSWLIKVLLGGVAITFVSWGGYQMTSQRSGRAATVNGETITAEEYRITY